MKISFLDNLSKKKINKSHFAEILPTSVHLKNIK